MALYSASENSVNPVSPDIRASSLYSPSGKLLLVVRSCVCVEVCPECASPAKLIIAAVNETETQKVAAVRICSFPVNQDSDKPRVQNSNVNNECYLYPICC